MCDASVMRGWLGLSAVSGTAAMVAGCGALALLLPGAGGLPTPRDPDTAARAVIDRFSTAAGALYVRDESNGLPGPDEPVDFDEPPFISRGLGPAGESVQYYNFDVQPTTAAPLYVLVREGESDPVTDQLNIIDAIPGDASYNDFWHVHMVTVPAGYVANTITSFQAITGAQYDVTPTEMLVNCPVVPEGSVARLRLDGGSPEPTRGWYRDTIVWYFTFVERALTVTLPVDGSAPVPFSDIFVTFNINPGEPGGGPVSGFVTEPGTDQSHNVVATLPENAGYSPLWLVTAYDNADFDAVRDLSSVMSANLLSGGDDAYVNCPVVSITETSTQP